jgi:hypothetical protein
MGSGPDGERGRRCELLAADGKKWRSRRLGRGLTPFLDASPNADFRSVSIPHIGGGPVWVKVTSMRRSYSARVRDPDFLPAWA